MRHREFHGRIFYLLLVIFCCTLISYAGVSRAIQDQYKKNYENKAMFLKIPVYSERQTILISGQSFRVEQGAGSPRFKVGDQLRVLLVDFGGEEIKFKLGAIGSAGIVELAFRFDTSLQEGFPNRDVFDRALQSTLTEGLKYSDIDDAKDSFVRDQFDRAVKEMAGSASISREAVLKNIAPFVPAYQEAQRDIDSLKNRVQDLSSQLSQSQSENRKLESDARTQQSEMARLRNSNASLQDKLESYTSQISKLGDEVKDAKGNAQGYQKELANIQRSLNIRVDSNRDLTAQISDLGQVLKKLQKDNDSLATQVSSLRTNLDAQQASNARLVADNEELKSEVRSLKGTLATLTSSKDSLGRQFLDLKTEKEKLDDLAQAVRTLKTRIAEESTDRDVHTGRVNVYLKEVLIGTLTWNIPAYLNLKEAKTIEAGFSAASIDYVRLNPDERHVLKTLGERLKVRLDIVSPVDSMTITPAQNKPIQETGERDQSVWQWKVDNQGSKDARLILTARLINKDSREIPIFQQESLVTASNLVRQVRSYLQPIALVVGIILGFLLFGIVGIFRRGSHRRHTEQPKSSAPPDYAGKKQL
jgi:predicted nuclease with TOPRIM domain